MDNVVPMPDQTPVDPTKKDLGPQLSLGDLAAVVQLIDVVSPRGAFKGEELAAVGELRGKFLAFVNAITPPEEKKKEEKKDEEAPAPKSE